MPHSVKEMIMWQWVPIQRTTWVHSKLKVWLVAVRDFLQFGVFIMAYKNLDTHWGAFLLKNKYNRNSFLRDACNVPKSSLVFQSKLRINECQINSFILREFTSLLQFWNNFTLTHFQCFLGIYDILYDPIIFQMWLLYLILLMSNFGPYKF